MACLLSHDSTLLFRIQKTNSTAPFFHPHLRHATLDAVGETPYSSTCWLRSNFPILSLWQYGFEVVMGNMQGASLVMPGWRNLSFGLHFEKALHTLRYCFVAYFSSTL